MNQNEEIKEQFRQIVSEQKPKEIIEERPIYYDGRQFSLKIPKSIMDKIGGKKGDKIRFILNIEKKELELEYVKKW